MANATQTDLAPHAAPPCGIPPDYISGARQLASARRASLVWPQDSDLNGVVDVRYTGGARMLLLIEVGQGRWRFKARLPAPSLHWTRGLHCPLSCSCKLH